MSKRQLKKTIVAYMYLSPALILFLVFFAIPIIAIIVLSFTNYDMISPVKFVGLKNFKRLFMNDTRYIQILWNTLKYVLIFVPAHTVLGLLLALGINRKISSKLKSFYRTAIYFPVLVTTSAVSIVWIYIYDKEFGLINYFLGKFGVDRVAWLTSSKWVYFSIAIFGIWKYVGQPTIFYLIGLQNISPTILEAADIDGANSVQKLFKIILPMISPTMFFVVVMVFINTLQIFEAPYILTRGGPGDVTRSLNLYIYEFAYERYEFGYASTLSLSLFILILIATVVMFLIGKKFVYYGSE